MNVLNVVAFRLVLLLNLVWGLDASEHSDNWAILVNTSRYWFNYRHATNIFTLYQVLKRQGGFDDRHLIVMSPDDFACNPRNAFPGTLLATERDSKKVERELLQDPDNVQVDDNAAGCSGKCVGREVYRGDSLVDFRGPDVTVRTFLQLLTGTHSISASTPTLYP